MTYYCECGCEKDAYKCVDCGRVDYHCMDMMEDVDEYDEFAPYYCHACSVRRMTADQ